MTSRMWWFDETTRRLVPGGRLGRPLADSAVVDRGSTAFLVEVNSLLSATGRSA